MEVKRFNIETVTPVFCKSYDDFVEIRPSSIKGMLRFWFRAAIAETELGALHKRENLIFGSTNQSSSFSIRIRNVRNKNGIFTKEKLLPHKSNFRVSAINRSTTFCLEFTSKNGFIKSEEFEIEDIVNLSLILGGLGQRSRRGFGSLKNSENEFKSKEDLLKVIKVLLGKLSNRQYQIKDNKLEVNDDKYYSYPVIEKVSFGQNGDIDDILDRIGKVTHEISTASTGNADPRMASPIYITVVEIENEFYPLITKLKGVYPSRINEDKDVINEFIHEIEVRT